ncbi:MAG: flagellar basal body rod protein FlgB [Butyrivibrio sp.]
MINSGAFAYVDLLKASADYSWKRNEVISSNIANVDTPNYKRQDVSFESVLSNAVAKAGSSSRSLTQTVRNIDYRHVAPTVYTDNSGMSYRIDGNNVDIDTEEVELASNQLYYQGVTDSITQNFNRIKSALTTT